MKKLLSLLLVGAMTVSFAACSKADDDSNKGGTTTAVTTAPEPTDDTLLYDGNFEFDLSEYITIPALSDLKLTEKEFTENWDALVLQIRQRYATYTDAEEGYEALAGDKVNIYYRGYAANESDNISEDTLKNMSNFQYNDDGSLKPGDDLVLGSGMMIGAYESKEHPEKNNAGFEDQLIGMKAGETRTITVTFPDSYSNSKELQGMEVKFDVTVNSIKKGALPELTDEMVAEYAPAEYGTIDALMKYYKSLLAYDALEKAAVISKYPTEVVDKEIADYIYDYIEYTYGGEELSDEESKIIFDEQYDNAKAYAEDSISSQMILVTLIDRYDIQLTYGEYKVKRTALFEADYFALSMYYGITTEEQFEEYFGRDQLVLQCKYELLLAVLAEEAVFE